MGGVLEGTVLEKIAESQKQKEYTDKMVREVNELSKKHKKIIIKDFLIAAIDEDIIKSAKGVFKFIDEYVDRT